MELQSVTQPHLPHGSRSPAGCVTAEDGPKWPKWPKVAPQTRVQCFSSSNDPASLMSKPDSSLTPC